VLQTAQGNTLGRCDGGSLAQAMQRDAAMATLTAGRGSRVTQGFSSQLAKLDAAEGVARQEVAGRRKRIDFLWL